MALWIVCFEGGASVVERLMSEVGQMPLPPYIRRPAPTEDAFGEWSAFDHQRYQTVFARHPGAVAAPTAGLHFTDALLARLRRFGVEVACLTLHVGAGTFLPVRVPRIDDHVMHDERFVIDEATARAVRRARSMRRRVVAVGTTVVRALEHSAREHGEVRAGSGRSDLFIRPGFEFRVVEALVTNFHLPRSTLLMLVSAFAGRERTLAAYREALDRDYRFYSYGDAMLIRSR